jgi:hypothetical protein
LPTVRRHGSHRGASFHTIRPNRALDDGRHPGARAEKCQERGGYPGASLSTGQRKTGSAGSEGSGQAARRPPVQQRPGSNGRGDWRRNAERERGSHQRQRPTLGGGQMHLGASAAPPALPRAATLMARPHAQREEPPVGAQE